MIISLQEGLYKYEPPISPPNDEREVLFHEFKKTDQFWRTPVIRNVKSMSQSERIKYIEKERERWALGVYAFINGELVYIPGMMYDHLVYMSFGGKKAEFFYHQISDFQFRDLVDRDVFCRGGVYVKPRRYGMTMEEQTAATYYLNKGMANNVALQSDTKEKARSTLLSPIITSYASRPKWMRSDYSKPNGKLKVSKIELKSDLAPDDNGYTKGDYILGWMKDFPSLPRSMDGEEVAYGVMDEVWKWTESSPKETLESNVKVLSGRNKAGKISVLSTMGDSDSYIRSVMDGCDIIARSNPKIRNENGYTLSGLYKYFVNAVYSFDIPPHVFEIDKFGKVNVDKHTEWIENQLKGLDKSSKSYVFEKRRMPLTESDALMSAVTTNYFGKARVNERLNYLRGLSIHEKPYVRANLIDHPNGLVEWKASEDGIWLWSVRPFVDVMRGIDTQNRFKRVGALYLPVENPEGCVGYDPINYHRKDTTSDSLSRAAATGHKKFDYFNIPGSKDYLADVKTALMLYRPDDPHDANKEVIKFCKYTGYLCMHERSVAHVREDFESAGMAAFLMEDDKGIPGIAPQNTVAKKDGLALMQARYSPPKTPEDKDHLAEHPFEDTLLDLDNFDFVNNTEFDAAMSEIYLELALKQLIYTPVVDDTSFTAVNAMHSIIPPRRH